MAVCQLIMNGVKFSFQLGTISLLAFIITQNNKTCLLAEQNLDGPRNCFCVFPEKIEKTKPQTSQRRPSFSLFLGNTVISSQKGDVQELCQGGWKRFPILVIYSSSLQLQASLLYSISHEFFLKRLFFLPSSFICAQLYVVEHQLYVVLWTMFLYSLGGKQLSLSHPACLHENTIALIYRELK